jgi:hypothetical protein
MTNKHFPTRNSQGLTPNEPNDAIENIRFEKEKPGSFTLGGCKVLSNPTSLLLYCVVEKIYRNLLLIKEK